jgi:hypothetical protein
MSNALHFEYIVARNGRICVFHVMELLQQNSTCANANLQG